MKKIIFILVIITTALISGCIGSVWTGANLIYDRHTVYKQVEDFQLAANANRALFKDELLKCSKCTLDLAVLNGDILIAGNLPNAELRHEAQVRLKQLGGYRRLYNQISIRPPEYSTIQDSWITAKIRSKIVADADINPHDFKIVTANHIVYIMGDVIPEQAFKVIQMARETLGVKRVVKIMRYYNLSDQPLPAKKA